MSRNDVEWVKIADWHISEAQRLLRDPWEERFGQAQPGFVPSDWHSGTSRAHAAIAHALYTKALWAETRRP